MGRLDWLSLTSEFVVQASNALESSELRVSDDDCRCCLPLRFMRPIVEHELEGRAERGDVERRLLTFASVDEQHELVGDIRQRAGVFSGRRCHF